MVRAIAFRGLFYFVDTTLARLKRFRPNANPDRAPPSTNFHAEGSAGVATTDTLSRRNWPRSFPAVSLSTADEPVATAVLEYLV